MWRIAFNSTFRKGGAKSTFPPLEKVEPKTTLPPLEKVEPKQPFHL